MARPKIEPILNLPVGLKLSTIRRPEHIPTSYVKKHFPLDSFRTNKTKYVEKYEFLVPLMTALAQIAPANQQGEYIEEDEDEDEDLEIYNIRISVQDFKKTLLSFLESPSLALFDVVELNRRDYCSSMTLEKTEIIYETDDAVIVKIKKKIFTEIQRYRRAKKGL